MKDPDAHITDREKYLKMKQARYALHQHVTRS